MPFDIILFSSSEPFIAGLYKEQKKTETFVSEKKTSDALLDFYTAFIQDHLIQTIYFSKGPGSFMSIKLTYVFLKTLALTKDIKLQAAEAFVFSATGSVPASKNSSFLKKEGTITLLKEKMDHKISLPEIIDPALFDDTIEPFYFLPPV